MKNLADILLKSSKGDQKAQHELYLKYRTSWYMISLRYGKNKMQAEDIMQEGMINIFKNLSSYNHNKAAFSTWSSRVLINAALSYLKKNAWSEAMEDLDKVYDAKDNNETIYDKLSAQELTRLIQNLPTGYRVIFNLYVLEGYTHKEIAGQLDITEGTSKSQLSKARRELRKKLETQLNYQIHE